MLPLRRSLTGVALALLLAGCPDPEADPTADMLLDQGMTVDATSPDDDASRPDAMIADAMIADAMIADAMIADATPPDATPPDRTTAAEICAGCGVARSADFTVIQRITPRRARVARSADFTLELLTAPITAETRR